MTGGVRKAILETTEMNELIDGEVCASIRKAEKII